MELTPKKLKTRRTDDITKAQTLKPKFYVYVLLDPRKPGNYTYSRCHFDFEPFYVGKGTKFRCKQHTSSVRNGNSETSSHRARKIARILKTGLEPIIKKKILASESDAFSLERKLIAAIGRGSKGPLTNKSDGGEGASGAKWSPEAKHRKSLQTKAWLSSLSPRERKRLQTKRNEGVAKVRSKIGQSVSAAFARQSLEMKEYLSEVHSKIARTWWESVSQEDRRLRGKNITKNYNKWRQSVSKADYQKSIDSANEKRAARRAARTPAEEAAFRKKLSEGVKRAYALGIRQSTGKRT